MPLIKYVFSTTKKTTCVSRGLLSILTWKTYHKVNTERHISMYDEALKNSGSIVVGYHTIYIYIYIYIFNEKHIYIYITTEYQRDQIVHIKHLFL